MINDNLPAGATPLTTEDAEELLPTTLSTREHLNQFESRNIQQALIWALRGKKKSTDILNLDYCNKLHKRMFNKTWRWAGQFRRYEVNIGNTPPHAIAVAVKNLCDDVSAWIEYGSYSPEEIGIRFHHKLVYIHPFPNGNGRHSRIMSDLLMISLGFPKFTWGRNSVLTADSESREAYIAALRLADNGNYQALLKFAQTEIH